MSHSANQYSAPPDRDDGHRSLSEILADIKQSIDARAERMIRLRRLIHATPEPSGEERDTTRAIAELAREAGLSPRLLRDDIGLVIDITLNPEATSTIALRAELDCVRVSDEKQTSYASTRPGLCHACGHDAHSTMILAAGLAIHDHLDALRGLRAQHNVRLIFQPAEETATGARSVIEQGAINDTAAILALHVDPTLTVGRVGVRTGPITASFKSFRITIKGRSGHSARPHEAIDPIPAAMNIIDQFYQLAPRTVDSRRPVALTVASINAGATFNAIPDHAVVTGTLRTTRAEDTDTIQRKMHAIARGVSESTGCGVDIDFVNWCPATDNDAHLTTRLADAARDLLGDDAVERVELPSMGGEDFAFYQELIPGAMARLGCAAPDEAALRPLHSTRFDIDERCLAIGAKLLAAAALDSGCRASP